MLETIHYEGVLPLYKPAGIFSFRLITLLRRATGIRKIGHAGTLDPFAEGIMILLIGRKYTKAADRFLNQDKEYAATMLLGKSTDTFDLDGKITKESNKVPTLSEIEKALEKYQGEIDQIPPMYSAKKIGGKKLYQLARKGIEIKREPKKITLTTTLIKYDYPQLEIDVHCSKGTYIRTLAHDIGIDLGTYAHLSKLTRTKNANFTLADCIQTHEIEQNPHNIIKYLCKSITV